MKCSRFEVSKQILHTSLENFLYDLFLVYIFRDLLRQEFSLTTRFQNKISL